MDNCGVVVKKGLGSVELDQLQKLAEVCNRYEGIEIKLNWDSLSSRPTAEANDFLYYCGGRIVGFAGIYQFLSDEAEVSGMVHPEHRRQGIFSSLVKEVKAEGKRRGLKRLVFIVQRAAVTGKSFVRSLGAEYSFSETVMEFRGIPSTGQPGTLVLRPAVEDDFWLLVELNRRGFGMSRTDAVRYVRSTLGKPGEIILIAEVEGVSVGKIGVIQGPHEEFIVGFCVLPEHRRKGYGRRILMETLKDRGQGRKVVLEVNSTNDKALELYKSCGFVETNTNDYYVLKL